MPVICSSSIHKIILHFSPDVVEDRGRFIREYEQFYLDAVKINPISLEIKDVEKTYLLISQDEKIHHR